MVKKRQIWKFIIHFVFILLFTAQTLAADTNPIQIGMTAPLSGEMQPIGEGVKIGVSVYFAKINAAGGINGRKLVLIALDDAYDPIRAANNVRQLINPKIFAMIGNMGSAAGEVTEPIVDAADTLLFAPITGNAVYREVPPDRNVFNFRASLKEETITLIHGALLMGIKPNEFAFFTQNDGFGDAVYQNAMNELKALGNPDPGKLPYGRFIRKTVDIEDALAQIIDEAKQSPKAFILAGNYESNAKFINLAHQQFPNAIFLAVSGRVRPRDVKNIDKLKLITLELVPYLDSNLPAINDYLADMKKYGAGVAPGYESLEGYLSAKVFVMAMQKAAMKNNLTRSGVAAALESMHDVDVGIGVRINFDKNDHQAIHQVWPITIIGDQLKPLKWPNFINSR